MVILIACLSLACAFARSETATSAFEAANKLYEQGKYGDAAGAYEKLAQSGQASLAVYFNLGNSYFKAGQIGRAIAAYRQAERLAPRDPDLRANLQFARSQTQGPTLAVSPGQRWLRKLTLNEWTLWGMCAFWLWLLLLAARQWRPAWKRTLGLYPAAAAVAAGLLGACLAAAFHEERLDRVAVVVARDAVVRHGPLEEPHNAAFTLHDGAELRVLDQKDEWLQITTDARRKGWVRRDQVLALGG
jgi:hypothetical protein